MFKRLERFRSVATQFDIADAHGLPKLPTLTGEKVSAVEEEMVEAIAAELRRLWFRAADSAKVDDSKVRRNTPLLQHSFVATLLCCSTAENTDRLDAVVRCLTPD